MHVISDIELTYNSLNIHSVMIQIMEVVCVCVSEFQIASLWTQWCNYDLQVTISSLTLHTVVAIKSEYIFPMSFPDIPYVLPALYMD